ncbi:MAG TPA: 30S ribosomal protein S9 [Patescibacteria group bacterium]|nr:30S ribosomal protein S9 [Patescibacteria group bacterium]
MINKRIITSGKRKTSVAKAFIKEGTGDVTINKRSYKTLHLFDKLKIEEPLRIAENILGKPDFDVVISVFGGGEKSQIEAARIALSKALVRFSKSSELERAFISYDRNLLVADVRRKEARKPGDSKARRKRQKSYR